MRVRKCSLCSVPALHDRRNCPNRLAVARAIPPLDPTRDFFADTRPEKAEPSPGEISPDLVRAYHSTSEAVKEAETRLRDSSYDLIREIGLALRKSQ